MDHNEHEQPLNARREYLDLEQPFWADEFGERIQNGQLPEVNEFGTADEFRSDPVTPISDSAVAPATSNDEEFHETLSDANVSDQLEDYNLQVHDPDRTGTVETSDSSHESFGDKIKEKLEDLRDKL